MQFKLEFDKFMKVIFYQDKISELFIKINQIHKPKRFANKL